MLELKTRIHEALIGFGGGRSAASAKVLLNVLGYESDRTIQLSPNNYKGFSEFFPPGSSNFDAEKAKVKDWQSIDVIFQLTEDDIRKSHSLFEAKQVDNTIIESYLFFAVCLKGDKYTRGDLVKIAREINKLTPMPAMIIFVYKNYLTIAVIDRRLHKRESTKDVLEKVTLIKDINIAKPHRAHVEILFDLSLDELQRTVGYTNFIELHNAWRKTLDIQTLNKDFFRKIRNWFYWARLNAEFPTGARKDSDGRDSEALIRLLTRMIFCWFLREKELIPEDLFSERRIEALLDSWHTSGCEQDSQGRYYKAILQNLFFATLSTPSEDRKFRTSRSYKGINKHYGDQRFFRHVNLFSEKAPVEELYKSIPFLNGGLFECLDEVPGQGDPSITKEKRIDGFSDVAKKQPLVPDFLFFGRSRPVPDIAELLGESGAPEAMGLLHIFRDYKFTVEENTPLEEDIALDPELLGRAFENLLATVNPETGTVARKSTGSFYTPREIVNYMVEEALVRYLITAAHESGHLSADIEERLRELISEEKESHRFNSKEADTIVTMVSRLKVLDPACGSGAFPMGILHKLAHILRKLDPGNTSWKAAKLAALPVEMREKAEEMFRSETFDYTRKLELIKDCIYGVDIQSTAIQISKLRFFLSLVIEQHGGNTIRPLPNLETKFVSANALLGMSHPEGWALFQHQIELKEKALLDVRARYFFALSKTEKDACRNEDRRLRTEMSEFIEQLGGSDAHALASVVSDWDPYRGGSVAGYFDPESMFGVSDGFDITIGNPPYVRADEQSDWNQQQRRQILASKQYDTLWEKWDLFVPFIERSYKLLRPGGVTTLIVSDAFCHAKYAQKPQTWFLLNSRIMRLDFCSNLKIFDAAVHNLIYFFQKADGTNNAPERHVHKDEFGNIISLRSDKQSNLTYRAFFPEDEDSQSYSCISLNLSTICYISVGMVVHADEKADDGAYQGTFELDDLVSDTPDSKHPVPFVEGKHLDRWMPTTSKWLEWGTKRAPSLFRRQTFEELYRVPEKLISVDMAARVTRLKVSYDNQQLFHNHSAWSFVPWHMLSGVRNRSLKKVARYRGERPIRHDLPKREELEATSKRFQVKYLLAVMNSTVARDFLRANRRSNIHLYPDDWKKLPIPDVPPEKQRPIVELVDKILTLRRANPQADIASFEVKIDEMVGRLYGAASGKD
jgi:adenine-specific DNA-methyltransferase